MEAKELRTLSVDELKTRVHQWQDELFRAKFKAQTSESKDSSIFRKLRRDIARGLTIMNEKGRASGETVKVVTATTSVDQAPVKKKPEVSKATSKKMAKAESATDKPKVKKGSKDKTPKDKMKAKGVTGNE